MVSMCWILSFLLDYRGWYTCPQNAQMHIYYRNSFFYSHLLVPLSQLAAAWLARTEYEDSGENGWLSGRRDQSMPCIQVTFELELKTG